MEKDLFASPTLMMPIYFIVRKLLHDGHRDQAVSFLVSVLEEADARGYFSRMKMDMLLMWLHNPLKDTKMGQNMKKRNPELADFVIPSDFPNTKEKEIIRSANILKSSQERLLIEDPLNRIKNLTASNVEEFLENFDVALNQITLSRQMVSMPNEFMEKLVTSATDSQKLDVFTKFKNVFKLAADQRYVLKLYLDYVAELIECDETQNLLTVMGSLRDYLKLVEDASTIGMNRGMKESKETGLTTFLLPKCSRVMIRPGLTEIRIRSPSKQDMGESKRLSRSGVLCQE